MTVLVLTGRLDPTADLVVTELHRRRVPVFRCDPADFPGRVDVAAEFRGAGWTGWLRTPHHTVDLGAVRSAYFRRPGPIAVDTGPAPEWATAEARGGFGGLLQAVPYWLNHPGRMTHAEYKPVQLAAAARAGLDTPRTLVTSDPDAARRFVAELPRVVYKAFSSTVRSDDGRRFIYTSLVTPADIDDGVRHTAHLFQEWIDKEYEIRLTVVGDRFFAARLTGRSHAARIDWRADYDAIEYAVADVPADVRRAVTALLAGLDLRFAAMDFAVRPDGRWVFLDLNPNGQWGWIEHETGLPIKAAITDALTTPPR
ncbi:ATP-grasp ribosomal peptide maturase [Actinocatenispora rupis]|uniref:ATP-grasp ribosomal peptide maturase n=1 Tax=Actinocatenispora rupis TaxID=519421 RepID=A0A8J3NCE7_9ACTN|nr:ATP-grasp ribosomal peptide maturase [Actinocatenispora rupis]GID13971.1 ATP-grasp ribosomal peptide maturase [Actinocatenispora rupis]